MDHEQVAFSGTARYAPTRLLGVGGMGAVYEVEDRTTGARVALKVMATSDPSRLLRFKNEFRVMAELYHPNLVRLFDLGTHEGQWFFTMELVDGSDLLQVLLDEEAPSLRTSSEASLEVTAAEARASEREAPARAAEDPRAGTPNARAQPASDPEAVVRVVAQVLDALEFLHAHGIVHRDLKPANILVDVDGVVRLLDFGLASRGDRELRISQEGALVGTLAYLSPEQLRGETASPASDLYALGCMLFQLLTGSLPFPGTLIQALLLRTEGPPPKIDERVLGVPEALVDVAHRLMARDPADRPTIGEVRAALGIGPRTRSARVRDRAASATTTGDLFVGRQRELAVIAGCLERAAAGQPQVVVVGGPSGIGKSAFASMVTRRAARLGFSCFAGRCYEREHLAFVAFDRVMDAIALTLRGRGGDALAPLRAPLLELERIFPALGLVTSRWADERPRDPDTVDPRALHARAFEALRTLVATLQAEAPLCFVLDDLQWADEESLALLQRLLELRRGRILVVALALPQALGQGTGLHAVLRANERHQATTTIALGALHAGDAVHLAEAVTGRRLAPATSAALVDQAEGNPFLMRMLAEHIAALPTADRADQIQAAASTEDLLRERMGALSPRADQVLALAAAAGGDVAMTLLRDASALPGEELDLAVGELLAAHLVKTVRLSGGDGDAAPRIDLYQERIREVAYRRLDAPARRAAHLALALALERVHATQGETAIRRGSDAEALVHHFTEAGDRDKRRRYAVEAAERAAQKLAFLRAARLFRIVLDDPEPGEDPLVTAARWERAGDLFDYGGHHLEAARAYEQAVRRWDAAPEAHPDRDAARLRLLGLIGAHLLATHDLAEGRAAFRRGLELVGLPFDRPVPARVAVLASLKVEAVAAERLGFVRTPRADPRASTKVRFFDHLVRGVQALWPWLAAEAALRAELASRRADDKVVLTRSRIGSAVVPVLLGRCSPSQIQRAHERLDAADELARAHDVPLGPELVQLHRALLWLTTNAARARRSADDALDGIDRRGMLDSFDGAVARVFHGLVLAQTGDDERLLANAERELSRSHENFVNVALALAVEVEVLARRGAFVEAREPLAKIRAHLAQTPPSRLGFIVAAAEAAVLVAEGRFQEALASADAAEADARRTGAWAIGFDRTRFHAVLLEAALGLARRGRLDPRDRAQAEARAEWLAARGVFDWGCLGHRARALLAHASGKRREAARALREALHQSSVNTGPHHRWGCLEAARDLGAMTREQELEAAELAEAGKYAKPVGWNG